MLGWIQSIFDLIRNIGSFIFYIFDNIALVAKNIIDLVDGIHDFAVIVFSELHSPLFGMAYLFFSLALLRVVVSFWGKGGGT